MAQIITRKSAITGRRTHQFRIRRKGGIEFTETFECSSKGRTCGGGERCEGGKEGAKWVRATEGRIDNGKASARSERTVDDVFKYYSETWVPANLKGEDEGSASQKTALSYLPFWSSRIGKLKLHEVTAQHIKDARGDLLSGSGDQSWRRPGSQGATLNVNRPVSNTTANHYLTAINQVFVLASQELGWIEQNPCDLVKRSKKDKSKKRWLNDEEKKALRAAAAKSYNRNLGLWVLAGIATGARQGELSRVTWSDVTLDGPDPEIFLGDTKNGTSRWVPLHPDLIEALRVIKDRKVVSTSVFGKFKRRSYENACDRAGLDATVTFHTLRHTAATEMGASGASERQLMAFFGWKSPAMVKIYVHNRIELTRDLRDKNAARAL